MKDHMASGSLTQEDIQRLIDTMPVDDPVFLTPTHRERLPVPTMPPALKRLDMDLSEDRPSGMNRAQRRRAKASNGPSQ